jgi:hypothetical protein
MSQDFAAGPRYTTKRQRCLGEIELGVNPQE